MKIKVIKIGGNVVENEEMLQEFARSFGKTDGPKILVHGGGVMASRLQKRLGIEPVMIEGRRVTDAGTLEIVAMVYAGWCNKHIVATLQKNGCNAMGLSGADGNVIKASRRPPVNGTDFGFVGDVNINGIDRNLIINLLKQGITPVFCAITHDAKGNLLNTNADTIASSIACALAAGKHSDGSVPEAPGIGYENEVELVYCFEKNGVLYDKNDENSVIREITQEYYFRLKEERRVADGMIPKLDNAFDALAKGVARVVIKHAGNLGNDIGTTLLPE